MILALYRIERKKNKWQKCISCGCIVIVKCNVRKLMDREVKRKTLKKDWKGILVGAGSKTEERAGVGLVWSNGSSGKEIDAKDYVASVENKEIQC